MPAPPLLLASASPRRLALLRQAGIEPDRVVAPEVDECILPGELPKPYVLRIAEAKAAAVLPAAPDVFIIAADTVVACGRRILPKTEDPAVARAALELLSGRRHRVWSGVAAIAPDGRRSAKAAMTHVRFKRLHPADIDAYLASDEWRGKAGAYAIQGRAEAFVPAITGSWSNVVGLPLALTLDMLRGLGWRPP